MPKVDDTKAKITWFQGIDDELLAKVLLWQKIYWGGEVHSTRKFMTPDGVKDKPTKMMHYIPFRELELDHMIRILETIRPSSPMLDEWRSIRTMWRSGKPLSYLPYVKSYWGKARLPTGIHRVMSMCFYPEHVNEIVSILMEAKNGQAVAAQKESGKDLFEQ